MLLARHLVPKGSIFCHALLLMGSGLTLSAAAQSTSDSSANEEARSASTLGTIRVEAQELDSFTVKETSGAAKLTLTPRETPQSMTVMTRERLENQNLTNLRSVLDNTPGVYSNAYDTERVLFYARGFLIDTLMYDGIPALANFSTGSLDQTLDTALYERIEIVRGATGLMTGAGNPAAAINLVRKHADSKAPTISASVTVGSWNNRRTEIDGTLPLTADGRIRARGVLAAEESDSYQALYRKKRLVGYGIVDADLTRQTKVSLGVDYQQHKPKGVTWGSFPLFLSNGSLANWPTSVTTATDWTYWNRSTQNTFGEIKHTFDNGWSIKSTLNHRQYKEDVQLFYMYGFPDATTGQGLVPYAYKSRNNIVENAVDVYATGPIELFGRKHELVFGYNGSRARNKGTENASDNTTLGSTGNFFQWDGSYAIPNFQADSFLSDIRTVQDAAYAVGRFSLADSLKLIAGARYARWKVDSNYVYDTPNVSAYNFSKLVPYTGLIWDFAQDYSAFASYTGIFKPQNNRDINGRYLDPMVGHSIEVGIKGEHFDKRLNTSFTVFQTKQDNVASAVLDPNTGAAILLPDGSSVSAPIDGTTTKGFELEASGRLTREVNASLGWTKYITRDATGTSIRTFIPSTLVRTFATWEPRAWVAGLTLGGGVNWQSKSNTTLGSPSGPFNFRQGSVALVSLMARYQITPNVSLQFNANNVTNRKYYVLDQYDNSYYGTPANYALTLRASY